MKIKNHDNLCSINLCGADLRNLNLRNIIYNYRTNFAKCLYNKDTRLPINFNPLLKGMIFKK